MLALRITPSFFSTFQRVPVVGQPFSDEHAVSGQDKAVILSHGLWRTRLGDDASIVGQNLRLNGEPYEVVGVMPPDFEPPFSQQIDLYVPFAFTPGRGKYARLVDLLCESRVPQTRRRPWAAMHGPVCSPSLPPTRPNYQ